MITQSAVYKLNPTANKEIRAHLIPSLTALYHDI